MTADEFKTLLIWVFGDPESPRPTGLYPQATVTPEMVTLWHEKLGHVPLASVKKAIAAAFAVDPKYVPALEGLTEKLKSFLPQEPPVPDWQHTLLQTTGATLHAIFHTARPLHDADRHLARCYREIADQGLYVAGQEAAFIAACQRFARQYPADAPHWQAHIATKQRELAASDHPPVAPPPQVGSFTHVSAPRPKRTTP